MMLAPTSHEDRESQPPTSSSIECSQPCRQFKFPQILLATDNFEESLVIGYGGFGKVYKGNITNGSTVSIAAIKRLDSMSSQGASEFWTEVEMLSKLRHCHLVSLFGYCNYEKEMILIYEYMPNGTLEDHLHKHGTTLSWLQRLRICIGAARGLDYLHTGTGIDVGVIHRDVKSSNILLDESWATKISDFGLSRVGSTNQSSTYVKTHVKGTFGYLDPNYYLTGMLTRKSDVYAFGVVLLEVLCRKRAVDRSLGEEPENLARWAQESIKEHNLKYIIDSGIRSEISPKCLKEFVRIVENCLLSNPKQRPMMAEVVVGLNSILTIQEKTNTSMQAGGKTIFEKVLDMFPSFSIADNSENGDLKLSSNSKGNSNVGDTVGANNEYFTIPITSLKVFKFADLKRATRDFSKALNFGMHGYGEVFLGWVDKNTYAPSTEGVGIAVAVKRHDKARPKWQRMVTILGQLDHPNIIRLVGYSNDEKPQCLLVYEYTRCQTLGHFFFTDVDKPLSWGTRLMIMIGVARGLAYMHSSKEQVIHCDIRISNIMLDEDFNARLGGFRMARFGSETGDTLASTQPMGHLSVKSDDIFGFGVVLLETVAGQRAVDYTRPAYQISLIKWASSFLVDNELKKIADPRLEQNYPVEGAARCVLLALRCVSVDHRDRPSSEEVLRILEEIYVVNKFHG